VTFMLREVGYGTVISLANIAVHAATMAFVINAARAADRKWPQVSTARLIAVMTAAVAVLMTAHTIEVAIWAAAYELVDAVTDGADQLYFAWVNFSTLGYGDITPVPRWRLLGPMTAMNGILLFGWSTAVLFEVLRAALRR
jgi:hypothetical protein